MYKILSLIASLEAAAGKAPELMLLFAAGWGKLDDGTEFLVDEKAFELIRERIAARGNKIHFDYEHASVQERAKLANGAPAAGWIEELIWDEGKGIMARVDWTDKAAAHIAAKEYIYFSPVFAINKTDKRVFYLDSVALTNRPRTNNLTPILAAIEAGISLTEEKMDRKKLIAALGLAADATDQMIMAAIAALGVQLPEVKPKEVIPEAITAALELEAGTDTSIIVANIHALSKSNENAVSRQEFEALQKQLADNQAKDAVEAAMKAGKITPANKDWAMKYAAQDPKGFETFVAKVAVAVPMDKLPGKTKETDSSDLTSEDLKVAALLGNDPEDVKKYKG